MYFIIMYLRQKRQPDIGDEWKLFIVLVEKQGVGEKQVSLEVALKAHFISKVLIKRKKKMVSAETWVVQCT